jgi:hypothetical protein
MFEEAHDCAGCGNDAVVYVFYPPEDRSEWLCFPCFEDVVTDADPEFPS